MDEDRRIEATRSRSPAGTSQGKAPATSARSAISAFLGAAQGIAPTGVLGAAIALVFVFGAFAMPLFSLSAAHANDRAASNEYVPLNAALMLFYSFGAIVGPFAAAAAMQRFGPHALFQFSAAVYVVFIALILWRMRVRAPAAAEERGRFTALLRTSTVFARLADWRNTERKR